MIRRATIPRLLTLACATTCIASAAAGAGRPNEEAVGRLVEVGGVQLYCRTIGSGEPLVVVHGGPGLGQDYLVPHFDRLADTYRLIYYDQRGCGRSSAVTDSAAMAIQEFVADLDGVRDAYGLESMHVAGQSWGAVIALEYVLAHPERVRSLLLLEPAPASSASIAAFLRTVQERLTDADRQEIGTIRESAEFAAHSPDAFRRYMAIRARAYFHDPSKVRLLDLGYFDTQRVRKFFSSSEALTPYLLSFDLYPRLAAVRCPALIVHGDGDPVPTEAVERMHEAIGGSDLHVIPSCGHYVHLEQPEQYFGLIRSFVDSLSAARRR